MGAPRRILLHDDGLGSFACDGLECVFDLVDAPSFVQLNLNAQFLGCVRCLAKKKGRRLMWPIGENGYLLDVWHKLSKQLQPLGRQVSRKECQTCRISSWTGQADNEAAADRVGDG